MATDWNEKLAFLLHCLPDQALGHLARVSSLHALLASLRRSSGAEPPVPPRLKQALDWIDSAADRPPIPAGDRAPTVQFASAPEWTHPISSYRAPLPAAAAETLPEPIARRIDEQLSRHAKDPRRQFLWLWRFLPEALATLDPAVGGAWMRMPADARTPDHSVWHRMSMASALATAAPDPTFLVIDVAGSEPMMGPSCTARDVRVAASLRAWLGWSAARELLQELGPDVVLHPSLRTQPLFDQWLSTLELQPRAEAPTPGFSDPVTFPSRLLALVPSAMANELGTRCVRAAQGAWHDVASLVRDKLSRAAGVSDAVWTGIWDRQIDSVYAAGWTAVSLEEDSTGAGALLASRDITALEKALKLRCDASGLDRSSKGLFFGIWQDAARAAASCRAYSRRCPAAEQAPRCTVCACREALHAADGDKANATHLFGLLAKSDESWSGLLGDGEALCAVCAVHRVAPALALQSAPQWPQESKLAQGPYAVVMLNGDNMASLLRGGLDAKETATLRSVMHSEMPAQLTSMRSRWRDLFDGAVLGGPLRDAAVAEALGEYAFRSVPSIVADAGGELVSAAGDEVIAIVPAAHAVQLARRLRERYRAPVVDTMMPQSAGAFAVLHPGPAATTSAIVALAQAADPVGTVVQRCCVLMQSVAKEAIGRDAIVVSVRPGEREALFACRWDELADSFESAVQVLCAASDRRALLAALVVLEPAITDLELDKTRNEPRAALIRLALRQAGLGEAELDRASRAILTLMERNAAPVADGDRGRALDGLQIARTLAEGVQ